MKMLVACLLLALSGPTTAIVLLVPSFLVNNNKNDVNAGGGGFNDALNTAGRIGDLMDITSDLMDGSIFSDHPNSQTAHAQADYYGNQASYGNQAPYGNQQYYGSQYAYGQQSAYATQPTYYQAPAPNYYQAPAPNYYQAPAANYYAPQQYPPTQTGYNPQTSYVTMPKPSSDTGIVGSKVPHIPANPSEKVPLPANPSGKLPLPARDSTASGGPPDSANRGCVATFVDIHEGKRRYLCNCAGLGMSYQYHYCGVMKG